MQSVLLEQLGEGGVGYSVAVRALVPDPDHGVRAESDPASEHHFPQNGAGQTGVEGRAVDLRLTGVLVMSDQEHLVR
jgi:hypothetical protein